jgi:hypothetical protein
MQNIVLFAVLFTEVLFFTIIDRKTYGNYLSPVLILSYPIITVIAFALCFGSYFGFKPVSSSLLILNICGLLVFWSGSFFWNTIIPKGTLAKIAEGYKTPKTKLTASLSRTIFIISWCVIGFMAYSFLITFLKYRSVSSIGTDEFARDYGGSGLAGHILGLSIPLMIYFIGVAKRKDYITMLTICGLLAAALLYQVKTWLYVPLIAGVLLRFYNEKKLTIKLPYIIFSIIAVFILFELTYLFSLRGDGNTFAENNYLMFKHFMGYIFAGVIGFGEHIKEGLPIGKNPEALLMPFVNLYNLLAGNEVTGVVSPYHVLIDYKGLEDVNVKTFFGTILITGGYIAGITYTVFISIALYFIYIFASITRNYWFVVLYTFFASALFLGWFDFYYNQLPFVELPVYIIVFIFLTNKKYG